MQCVLQAQCARALKTQKFQVLQTIKMHSKQLATRENGNFLHQTFTQNLILYDINFV